MKRVQHLTKTNLSKHVRAQSLWCFGDAWIVKETHFLLVKINLLLLFLRSVILAQFSVVVFLQLQSSVFQLSMSTFLLPYAYILFHLFTILCACITIGCFSDNTVFLHPHCISFSFVNCMLLQRFSTIECGFLRNCHADGVFLLGLGFSIKLLVGDGAENFKLSLHVTINSNFCMQKSTVYDCS